MPASLSHPVNVQQDIWYRSGQEDQDGIPAVIVWALAGGQYLHLRYRDGTEFLIDRQGTQIWASWPLDSTFEDTLTYLLGPVLGYVLYLRGVICLHGSALCVGDQAIVLVGPAGAGKSTTAAAFAKLGYPILSEDIVPLRPIAETFLVVPGYPRVCLWPKAVDAIYGSVDALPRITPTWDKRYVDLTQEGYRFQPEPLALAAIYILGGRSTGQEAPFIENMAPAAALVTLIGNTYAANLPDNCAMRSKEFNFLGRIVSRVPVRWVTPHADSTNLFRLCDTIVKDFGILTPTATL